MRRKKLSLLSALGLCLLGTSALANDIEPGKEFYTVIYAPNPIVLDGDLSEWSGVPVLADPKFAVPKFSGTTNPAPNYVLFEEYSGGTWTGPDDQTSAVQIVYDADNVYFGFVVTDDYHENAANSAWNGDSVQLMIASADRTTEFALYNYALGGTEEALGDEIVQHERGGAANPDCNCETTAVIRRDTVNNKTIYEIKLPRAAVGLTSLKGGPQFGLGMAINDGDAGPGQAGQKGWGGLGAHAIVFGKTPSETAQITLAKGNDIEPSKEYYTALRTTNTIVVNGTLSEWSGAPVLADPKFAVPKFSGTNDAPNYVLFEEYSGGTWTGPDDQTSAVQVVYDADNVYFGFVVTDDYHENAANSAWNGDSVQLMIASADRTTEFALYNYALGGVEDALGDVIIMHERGGAADPACGCDTTARVTRDVVANKTYYEIKLPAAVGLTPPLTVGMQFGLGMAINDGDAGAGQNGQRGWGGLGAHSIVFGKTPSETAQVTLGTTVSGSDRLFLSAINPGILTFSFRANDKGTSIVAPATAKLTIDGQPVTLTPSPKSGDATDFTYSRSTLFAPGSHTYAIEVRDTLGNIVRDSGTFLAQIVPVLTAPQKAVSTDTTKPGFIWRVFQNEAVTSTDLADAELALTVGIDDGAGGKLPNNADPNAVGIAAAAGTVDGRVLKFEIPSVVNVSQLGGDLTGNFTPDDQMPGVPGLSGLDDGIVAEIVTFVDLPAGLVTLGVSSEDGNRTQAGYINTVASRTLLGEFPAWDSLMRFVVQDAGVYPLRIVYLASTPEASIELYSVKANGDKVLLNDTANGGLRTYRVGVVPTPSAARPTLTVARNGNSLTLSWTGTGTLQSKAALDAATWTDVPGASASGTTITPDQTRRFFSIRP